MTLFFIFKILWIFWFIWIWLNGFLFFYSFFLVLLLFCLRVSFNLFFDFFFIWINWFFSSFEIVKNFFLCFFFSLFFCALVFDFFFNKLFLFLFLIGLWGYWLFRWLIVDELRLHLLIRLLNTLSPAYIIRNLLIQVIKALFFLLTTLDSSLLRTLSINTSNNLQDLLLLLLFFSFLLFLFILFKWGNRRN